MDDSFGYPASTVCLLLPHIGKNGSLWQESFYGYGWYGPETQLCIASHVSHNISAAHINVK